MGLALGLLLLVGLALAAAKGGKGKDWWGEENAWKEGKVVGMPATRDTRQRRFRQAVSAVVAADDMAGWLRFLEAVALHESDFNPLAWNKTPTEAAASAALGARNGEIEGVDFSAPEWGFGSRGLFQFLGGVVAISGGRLRFPRTMTRPDMAYRPGVAVAAAFDFARRLQGWKDYRDSWASLWVGWKNPSDMDQPAKIAAAAKSLEDLAERLGWPRGWALGKPSKVPLRTPQEMEAWAETADDFYAA